MSLEWDASYEADDYTVTIDGTDYSAEGTSLTVSPLAAGSSLCALVSANNTSGSSAGTDAGCVDILPLPGGDHLIIEEPATVEISPTNIPSPI